MSKIKSISSTSTHSTTNDLLWSYTPVQHSEDRIAVHAASYDKNGAIVHIDREPQKLEDLSTEHMINFLSQIMVGVVNKPVVSPAQFKKLARKTT
jgi:hypothetical protein